MLTVFTTASLLICLMVLSFFYVNKKIKETSQSNNMVLNFSEDIKKEITRRISIINKVETFIQGSKFVEPIAIWKNDKIYKYVFNSGYLYEFYEILEEKNQKIGIDDEYLCFKQCMYKRVNDPISFIEKFDKALNA